MNIRGNAGQLRVGYQLAADLGAWDMAPKSPATFAFTARVKSVNDYWITQEPLDLVLRVGRTEWIWRGLTVTVADGTLYADLRERPIVERAFETTA